MDKRKQGFLWQSPPAGGVVSSEWESRGEKPFSSPSVQTEKFIKHAAQGGASTLPVHFYLSALEHGAGRRLWEKTGIRKSKCASKRACGVFSLCAPLASSEEIAQHPENTEGGAQSLLPWPLWCRVGVGIDRRRCWVAVVWHSYIGFRGIRWSGVRWHVVRLAVGDGVGRWGDGRRGVRKVKVERSRRSGGRSRRRDPLQDDMWVQLRVWAVEPGHGGLQQALLTPGRERPKKNSMREPAGITDTRITPAVLTSC